MTKEEFKVLVMLYAASIDGNINNDELELILEKTNKGVFDKMKKKFLNMSDSEMLDCLAEYKNTYLSSQEDCRKMLDDMHEIFSVDDRYTIMERYLFRVIEKVLK